jgi:hypothetical protein
MKRPEDKQVVGRPYKTNFARTSPLQVSTLSSTQSFKESEKLFLLTFAKRDQTQ